MDRNDSAAILIQGSGTFRVEALLHCLKNDNPDLLDEDVLNFIRLDESQRYNARFGVHFLA